MRIPYSGELKLLCIHQTIAPHMLALKTSHICDGKQAANNQLITIIGSKKQMLAKQGSYTGWVTLIKLAKHSLSWTTEPILLSPCQSTQFIRLPTKDKQHLFKSSCYQSTKIICYTLYNIQPLNCYYMVHVLSTSWLENVKDSWNCQLKLEYICVKCGCDPIRELRHRVFILNRYQNYKTKQKQHKTGVSNLPVVLENSHK